uniref:Elongation factor 1 beta (Fragments) n=1 Tax=Arabidopsis thaliana TaxID=3702 RepID=Q9S9I3_ARATH
AVDFADIHTADGLKVFAAVPVKSVFMDVKKLEEAVRSIKMEGLLWGASKLMPVGYGIKK